MNDRTKIATDLRHAADYPRDWMRRLDPRLGVPHNTLYEMMRVTGCFENHKSANPPMLFHRLADLIEPKAKIMIDMNGCPGDDYRFCGSCKRTLSNGLFDDYKITHCPYCGCLLEEPY